MAVGTFLYTGDAVLAAKQFGIGVAVAALTVFAAPLLQAAGNVGTLATVSMPAARFAAALAVAGDRKN